MNGYLLDTNVVSRFAPGRPEAPDGLRLWMHREGEADRLFIASMTVAEISRGVRQLRHRGASARADALAVWFDGIVAMFEDRILGMDLRASLLVGELEADVAAKGFAPGLADVIIAATAKAHDLIVVTGNIRHFEPFGISVQLPPGLEK